MAVDQNVVCFLLSLAIILIYGTLHFALVTIIEASPREIDYRNQLFFSIVELFYYHFVPDVYVRCSHDEVVHAEHWEVYFIYFVQVREFIVALV